MELNIDFLINLFEKHSNRKNTELGEQEAGGESASSGGGGGKGYPKVPKWNELYQIKRGKANKLGAKGEKWNTEMVRGVGNQIW